MPLSPAAPRERLHTRTITMDGYRREDGMFDIEGHITDVKAYAFDNHDRGRVEPGTPLHGMRVRLTVDEDLLIHAAEAVTEFAPYAVCPAAAPNFAALCGGRIGPGWNRLIKERVGGTLGCTHIREMLAQMATVAFQTIYPVRRKRELEDPEAARRSRERMIGTCLAYAPDSPVVRERWAREPIA